MSAPSTRGSSKPGDHVHDVIVIGAGFAGMYLVHKLRDDLAFDVVGFERGGDVGGTWYWNRYPGARCDFESDFYSYSFDASIQQDWEWTERYAAQPEILSYAGFVADRLDLRRSFQFNTTVERAEFDEKRNEWSVTTDAGGTARARFLVAASGILSVPSRPPFDGVDDFQGQILHTGQWPHEPVDFTGSKVAVIGTGSSGIQVIPMIAEQADELTVFQRTATFTFPAANRPLTKRERRYTKKHYPALRAAARQAETGVLLEAPLGELPTLQPEIVSSELERRWRGGGWGVAYALTDVLVSEEANEVIADFARRKIHAIVDDPETARLLEPHDYPVATKRVVLDTDYYETFNRPNVHLVSVRDTPIERFTAHGVVVDGREYEADVIVMATGYDSVTGALTRIEVIGTGGAVLGEEWRTWPRSYLGLAVHGFPNLFLVNGPGSPAPFSNVIATIEHHVEWISAHLDHLRTHGICRVEAEAGAEEGWTALVAEYADQTLYTRANSWYIGANIPGKPRAFLAFIGGVPAYRALCDDSAAAGYRGFTHTLAADPVATPQEKEFA